MIKKMLLTSTCVVNLLGLNAQDQKSDTVVINLANTSKIIFTMQDRNDLDILKHYDFQNLFKDIILRLEQQDSAAYSNEGKGKGDTLVVQDNEGERWSLKADDDEEEDWEKNDDTWEHSWSGKRWRTSQSFNFDLGTNNYLEEGKFPDSRNAIYSVRPWGSWYFAATSVQRTRAGHNFFLEWGIGVSWYNFKFQKDNIVMAKDDDGVSFIEDTRDANFKKSKLTASYINASLVPVFDFGDNRSKPRVWDHHNSFRIGAGPYVGYRIGSYSKVKYKEAGDTNKDKNRDNYYLENIRYGMRLQVGFRSTDLFFNYDMNELFTNGKGPSLNAFSFGVIF